MIFMYLNMKLLKTLLLICMCIASVCCLHLSSHKENHKSSFYRPSHKGISYYGRHYLSHRSQEYIQKVKADNKEKIEEFNNKNKEALKKDEDGNLVKGGHSYAMGKTKFLQFTQEEFVHMFTGLKRNEESHQHHEENEHEVQRRKTSISEDIYNQHFLNKVNPKMSNKVQQTKVHTKKVDSHKSDDEESEAIDEQDNEQSDENDDDQDQDWEFENPYEIDDGEMKDLYGDVNNDDSWGWNWKQFDDDYYDSEDEQDDQDYDDYWNEWEDDHWGYDDQDEEGRQDGGKSPWWKKWNEEAEQNEDNEDWWYDDQWDSNDDQGQDQDEGQDQDQEQEQDQGQDDGKNQEIDDDQSQDNEDEQDQGEDDDNEDEQGDDHKTFQINFHPAHKEIRINHNSGFKPYPNNAVQVNWALKGATTHVKNQGVCGSCWTYSAVGVVEAYLLIKGKGVTDLSEQQILDCQRNGCSGCDGGQQNMGLQFAVKSGLVAESKYPYRGVQQRCAQKTGPHKVPKYFRVSGRAKLQDALRKGPITAAVYVDEGFQFYERGIFDKCQAGVPNHAVVLVGFGKGYWIVRNSWGADWGEKGHIRIKKNQNKNNACSIQSDAYAISS